MHTVAITLLKGARNSRQVGGATNHIQTRSLSGERKLTARIDLHQRLHSRESTLNQRVNSLIESLNRHAHALTQSLNRHRTRVGVQRLLSDTAFVQQQVQLTRAQLLALAAQLGQNQVS